MNLLNKKWYRDLFPSKIFVKVDSNWIESKNYKKGKVTEVQGRWKTQAFCDCGNELVHSRSFVQERETSLHSVFDYTCSHCKKELHFNPDIIPGLLRCHPDGTPI